MLPVDVTETLAMPLTHTTPPKPKSTDPASTNGLETTRGTHLGFFWVSEHVYDAAEDSCRRLSFELDISTTVSSYPCFQPQSAAHKHARLSVLAFFGSLNLFMASVEFADAIVNPTSPNPFPDQKTSTQICQTNLSGIFWSFGPPSTPIPPHPCLHIPSAPRIHLIASEDTRNGEFATLVVPEAKGRPLDTDYAGLGVGLLYGGYGVATSTMEGTAIPLIPASSSPTLRAPE
uniref:Uncharacterized protein n=1 Tax=Moniliophthora roreri TaxID=221103 RepID=A0A0W0GCS1_MONRR